MELSVRDGQVKLSTAENTVLAVTLSELLDVQRAMAQIQEQAEPMRFDFGYRPHQSNRKLRVVGHETPNSSINPCSICGAKAEMDNGPFVSVERVHIDVAGALLVTAPEATALYCEGCADAFVTAADDVLADHADEVLGDEL